MFKGGKRGAKGSPFPRGAQQVELSTSREHEWLTKGS